MPDYYRWKMIYKNANFCVTFDQKITLLCSICQNGTNGACFGFCHVFVFFCCNKLSSTRMSKEWKRINREKLIFLYSLHSTKTDAKLPVFHKMPLKTEASLVTGTHDRSKCVAGRRGLSLCQCGSCSMLYFINPHTGVREWEGRN